MHEGLQKDADHDRTRSNLNLAGAAFMHAMGNACARVPKSYAIAVFLSSGESASSPQASGGSPVSLAQHSESLLGALLPAARALSLSQLCKSGLS